MRSKDSFGRDLIKYWKLWRYSTVCEDLSWSQDSPPNIVQIYHSGCMRSELVLDGQEPFSQDRAAWAYLRWWSMICEVLYLPHTRKSPVRVEIVGLSSSWTQFALMAGNRCLLPAVFLLTANRLLINGLARHPSIILPSTSHYRTALDT